MFPMCKHTARTHTAVYCTCTCFYRNVLHAKFLLSFPSGIDKSFYFGTTRIYVYSFCIYTYKVNRKVSLTKIYFTAAICNVVARGANAFTSLRHTYIYVCNIHIEIQIHNTYIILYAESGLSARKGAH